MNSNSKHPVNTRRNHQRIRPAVALLCGLVPLGVGCAIWLLPKLFSDDSAGPVLVTVVEEEPIPQQATAVPKMVVPPKGGQPPQDWGIEVVGLYPSIGGRVLDLRYRILDTAKAAKLPNETGGIYLMDETTGFTTKSPNSPKTGSIPKNPQKLESGRSYSLAFPNPEGRFKSGSKVTLVIGKLRAEHLAVQ
jgi:hypothetical protein